MQVSTKHTCNDVMKMQKIGLPADNSCTRQPIAAEARRDISNALIKNEIARAPAMLFGPSNIVSCYCAFFWGETSSYMCHTTSALFHDLHNVSQQTSYAIVAVIRDALKRSLGTHTIWFQSRSRHCLQELIINVPVNQCARYLTLSLGTAPQTWRQTI